MRWFHVVLVVLVFFLLAFEVGTEETVLIDGTPVSARIDTGAEYSSIDAQLADSLGLADTGRTARIIGALGSEERRIVSGTLTIGDRTARTEFTVADRTELGTDALIGRRDLAGATVVVGAANLTEPVPGLPIDRLLLLIPILASLILLLRLVIGLRTYGVFGPVVIALSLIIGIGIALLLDRVPWPLIARIAILLFALAGASMLLDRYLLMSVFPLIITAFLVEKFSESLQVHELREGLLVLIITLLAAAALALVGEALLPLPQTWFLIASGAGLAVSIGCASYTGLRISELWRFR